MLQQQRVKSQPRTVQSQGLALAPTNEGVKFIMTDKPWLKPWAVVRQRPNLQWLIIARYRSRADADGHLLLLRQRVPNIPFKVVFELGDSASRCYKADRNEY
jgi:hypothetical protein